MLDRIAKAQQQIDHACRTLGRPITVMEVCGTHTVAIFRSGIRSTLPEGLRLLSGPGCPVCVTDQGYIDLSGNDPASGTATSGSTDSGLGLTGPVTIAGDVAELVTGLERETGRSN